MQVELPQLITKTYPFFSMNRWNNDQQSGITNEQEDVVSGIYGFGSISRRQSNKPIIAAVSGGAYGGGMEMLMNCDYVVASQDAKFALPEVKRGVIAIQGGKTQFPVVLLYVSRLILGMLELREVFS